MIKLNCAPAFGFETTFCNSEEWYKDLSKKQTKTIEENLQKNAAQLNIPEIQNSINDLTTSPEYQGLMGDIQNDAARNAWKVANLVKVLGYIPLLGTLIGINRLARAVQADKNDLPNRCNHIVRGCVELLSLGALLLIPDLILTCYRGYQTPPQFEPVPSAG